METTVSRAEITVSRAETSAALTEYRASDDDIPLRCEFCRSSACLCSLLALTGLRVTSPAIGIRWIIDPLRHSRKMQRMEGIDHHRHLFRTFGTQAFLHHTRLWTMRNTTRMQCNRCFFDATPTAKIAIDIVEHLIAIDIAMVVRDRHRQWMIIQLSWHKRADYKVRSLERLMDGRWLMYTSRNWFEIVDIQDPGIGATIPTHNIQGMMRIPVACHYIPNFDMHRKLAALSVRNKLFRSSNITLATVSYTHLTLPTICSV